MVEPGENSKVCVIHNEDEILIEWPRLVVSLDREGVGYCTRTSNDGKWIGGTVLFADNPEAAMEEMLAALKE